MSKKQTKTNENFDPFADLYDESDPGDFFDGYQEESIMSLRDGQGIKGQLLGRGEPLLWEGSDGTAIEAETWELLVKGVSIRLIGKASLDKKLGEILDDYEAPVEVAILRTGKGRTKKGYEMAQFRVGVKGGKKRTKETR